MTNNERAAQAGEGCNDPNCIATGPHNFCQPTPAADHAKPGREGVKVEQRHIDLVEMLHMDCKMPDAEPYRSRALAIIAKFEADHLAARAGEEASDQDETVKRLLLDFFMLKLPAKYREQIKGNIDRNEYGGMPLYDFGRFILATRPADAMLSEMAAALERQIKAIRAARDMAPDSDEGLAGEMFARVLNAAESDACSALAAFRARENG